MDSVKPTKKEDRRFSIEMSFIVISKKRSGGFVANNKHFYIIYDECAWLQF